VLDGGDKKYGMTALMIAAREGQMEIARLLLQRGAAVDMPDALGLTALHVAAINGQDEIVSLLLEAGAEPRAQVEDGRTPLMMAAGRGHLGVVRVLLEHAHTHINQRDSLGGTALWWACECGEAEVAKALFSAGADLFTPRVDGRMPQQSAWQVVLGGESL
jgi:ankyrin repeat protein